MPLFTGTDSDGVVVTAGGQNWFTLADSVVSNSGAAFDFSTFSSVNYTIYGTVLSDTDTVISADSSNGNTVSIAEGGHVFGDSDAIELRGTSDTVVNHGEIIAIGDAAVQLFRSDDLTSGEVINHGTMTGFRGIVVEGGNVVINTGTITGIDTAVELDSNGGSSASAAENVFTNTGTIFGGNHGVEIGSMIDALTRIVNSGTIAYSGSGAGEAIEGLSAFGPIEIENAGTILGDVVLGSGDDIVDSRLGEIFGRIDGNAGNDTLIGGAADETIEGGNDDDLLEGGLGGDVLDGGSGIDTASYERSTEGVVINLSVGWAARGEATGDTLTDIENLVGTGYDDVLVGGSEANTFVGGYGNDTLRGWDGDDYFEGGDGADVIQGGDGSDTADYSNSFERVLINLSAGHAGGGQAAGDTLSNIENVVGTSKTDIISGSNMANELTGGADADQLRGWGGADVLYGGSEADLLEGGQQDDELYGGTEADTFVYRSGWAADTIHDFEDDIDEINLAALFANVTAALNRATEIGADTVFDFGGGNTLTVLNTTKAELQDDILV